MTRPQTIVAPATSRRIPWCTLLLCLATAVVSVHTAIEVGGTWLARVRIVELEHYGLRVEYLREFELWRLVTAQLVHVKQPHMVSDVFCLLLVGTAVERNMGFVWLLVLWLIGGSMATLISTLSGPPPWNLGTGASQAIMAIAGAGLWLTLAGVDRSKFLLSAVAFSIALALTLDLIFAHHPKPGHVAGLLLGFVIAAFARSRPR
jgi:membrane associated rhomboid family serine protease